MSRSRFGFTLAELLIALAMLGVIATFTIPKILSAQQDSRNNAVVKEAASAMSAAFQTHRLNGLVTTSTRATDLLSYLNYTSLDTAGNIDAPQTNTTYPCQAANPCARLHSGAVVRSGSGVFLGTNTTNAIQFWVDPDGTVTDGTTNGPGKSVSFFIYYNGRIVTHDGVEAGTLYNGGAVTSTPSLIPPWFSW